MNDGVIHTFADYMYIDADYSRQWMQPKSDEGACYAVIVWIMRQYVRYIPSQEAHLDATHRLHHVDAVPLPLHHHHGSDSPPPA